MQYTGATLDVYRNDRMGRAREWARMSDPDLKREAIRAARDRDLDALWSLVEAHMTLHGSSGAKASEHTLRAYQRGVKDLIGAWQGENLLRPSRDAGVSWLRQLEADGKSASTIRVKVAAAKALYAALRWARATDAVPFADSRPAKDKANAWDKRQPYTETELSKLLQVADPHDKVMLLLGAHAGLRVAEMVSLQWADVDLTSQRLMVRNGKGSKTRRIVISSTLAKALAAINPDRNASGRVLAVTSQPGAYHKMKALCERAEVPCKGLHALRHYAGTRLAREKGIREAAEHLGHNSLETARVYAKWDERELEDSVGNW